MLAYENLGRAITIAVALGISTAAGCDGDGVEYAADSDDAGDDEQLDRVDAAPYPTGDANLGIVTFNVGMEDDLGTYEALRQMLRDTDRILVLQEVQDVSGMRQALSLDFPYETMTQNYTDKSWDWSCFCRRRKRNHVVVLSKLPIVHQESHLVQTDPGGDRWRRHGQYVRIKVESDLNVHLFHYHNTYNWHEDSSQSEKSGMVSYRDWVESKVGAIGSAADEVVMAGDFNLSQGALDDILGTSLSYQSDWVDHIVSTNASISAGGSVDSSSISDHDLVWAELDLVSNIETAEDNVVRLYEHSDFSGASVAFERGSYPNIGDARGSWWNDRVSSMIVGGEVVLDAWEHSSYGGTRWCLPHDGECGTSGYNDEISSLKVMDR